MLWQIMSNTFGISVKNIFIFIVSRIIKIFANLSKLGCYVFHAIFPKKRFTLPKQSPPIFKTGTNSTIPKIIWQTNYTNRVTLPVYINYLFNRLFSPTFEYRFMITEDRAEFIKSHYSEDIYNTYLRLQIGAAQADLWRLLVLNKIGGVYMDIDAHLVWPLGFTIKPEYAELYIKIKNGEISNYFIASSPNNNRLEKMINIIITNINENTLKNVYDLTGPGVFNQVLSNSDAPTTHYRYTCNQGNFTNEYFQYVDKPQGKWTKAQQKIDIVKK